MKTSGLPSSACTTSTSAFEIGRIVLLDERLAIGRLDEVLDGVVEDRARAEHALEDRSRRLARSEARDTRAAREVRHGIADRAVEAVGRDLDTQLDGGVGPGRGGDLHRPAV